MQTTAKITDINIDFETKKTKISLLLDTNELDVVRELKNEDKLNIDLKKYRQKRSLDANAYCWVLCDKIAKVIGSTKEEVYKDAISNIGSFEPMIAEEKNFDKVKRVWENQGLGFLIKEITRKNKCVKFLAYYGSSTYDTKEMSLLIDLLVQQAKEIGIETMPEAELKSLLEAWH